MRTQKGFTLIELIVAMVVAAILAAIAIPAYSNYVRKAHRTEAKSALLDLASLEERYFSTQNQYSTDWSLLGYAASTSSAASISVGNGYYTVSFVGGSVASAVAPTATTTGTPASFSLQAQAVGDQLKDTTCTLYIVSSNGTRAASSASNTDSTSSCW